jgi:hypothetical protein
MTYNSYAVSSYNCMECNHTIHAASYVKKCRKCSMDLCGSCFTKHGGVCAWCFEAAADTPLWLIRIAKILLIFSPLFGFLVPAPMPIMLLLITNPYNWLWGLMYTGLFLMGFGIVIGSAKAAAIKSIVLSPSSLKSPPVARDEPLHLQAPRLNPPIVTSSAAEQIYDPSHGIQALNQPLPQYDKTSWQGDASGRDFGIPSTFEHARVASSQDEAPHVLVGTQASLVVEANDKRSESGQFPPVQNVASNNEAAIDWIEEQLLQDIAPEGEEIFKAQTKKDVPSESSMASTLEDPFQGISPSTQDRPGSATILKAGSPLENAASTFQSEQELKTPVSGENMKNENPPENEFSIEDTTPQHGPGLEAQGVEQEYVPAEPLIEPLLEDQAISKNISQAEPAIDKDTSTMPRNLLNGMIVATCPNCQGRFQGTPGIANICPLCGFTVDL